MKLLTSLAIAASLIFSVSSASAGNFTGTVERVLVQAPGLVFFSLGGQNNAPACQGGSTDFAIDITTALGKAQYAMILTAQATEQTLVATGKGVCDVWPDRESLNFMFTQPAS